MSDSAPKSKLAYNIRLTVLFAVMAGIGGYYAFDNGYLDFYLPADWKKKQENKVVGVPDRFKNRKEKKPTEEPKKTETKESSPKNNETETVQADQKTTNQESSTEPETAESNEQPAADKTTEATTPSLADLESPNQVEPPVVTPPEETVKTEEGSTDLETEPVAKPVPDKNVAVSPEEKGEAKQTKTEESPAAVDSNEVVDSNNIPTPTEQREDSLEQSSQTAQETAKQEKTKQEVVKNEDQEEKESPEVGTVVDPSKPSALQQLTNATSPHVETSEKPVVRNAPVPRKVQRYAALLMRRYDLDRSLRIEPGENKQAAGIPQEADLNGDGNITQQELAQYLANYGQGRKIRLITPYAPAETEETAPVPEASGPAFEAELNEEEQKTAMELELERRRSLKFAVNTKRLPSGLPPWFLSRDNNGDGQLTLGEFAPNANKSAIEEFRKIDRNQDGLVTPKELVRGNKSTKKESASNGS